MNSIIIFCVLLVTCYLTEAKSKTDISTLLIYASQNSNCHKQGLQCKDCESIQFCSGSLQSLFAIRCADQNSLQPYCDSATNSCTDAAPSVCDIGDSTFICPGIGNYPDALDCTKYFTCNENKIAHKQTCQDDTIYDHATQSCQANSTCLSYSPVDGLCSGIANKYLPYELSINLYILCLVGHEPAVLQCPKGETFSESDESCKFVCNANGFFPHAKDSTKFYSCIIIGSTVIQNKLECLYGTEFIETGEGKGVCSIRTTTTSTTTTTTTTESIAELTTEIVEIETTSQVEEEDESKTTEETNFVDTTIFDLQTTIGSDDADVIESNDGQTTEKETQDSTNDKEINHETSTEKPNEEELVSNEEIKETQDSTNGNEIEINEEMPNEESAAPQTPSEVPIASDTVNEEILASNEVQDNVKEIEIHDETPNEEPAAPQTPNVVQLNSNEEENAGNNNNPTKETDEVQVSNEDDNQLDINSNIENPSIEVHSTEINQDENQQEDNNVTDGSGNSAASEEILEENLGEEIAKEIENEFEDKNVEHDISNPSEEISIIFQHKTEYEEEIIENYL